jgi:hypothetical protein
MKKGGKIPLKPSIKTPKLKRIVPFDTLSLKKGGTPPKL